MFTERIWGNSDGTKFLCGKDTVDNEWKEWRSRDLPKLPRGWRDYDMYFAPNVFRDQERTELDALPPRWLYADLDQADPECVGFVRPSICVETSPGRYQAYWELARSVSPRAHKRLNQRVTYITGADKGGWGLSKVLRIPGTYNYKRGSKRRFKVQVLWDDETIYDPKDLWRRARAVEAPNLDFKVPKIAKLPDEVDQEKIPPKLRRSIKKRPTKSDDRSKVLYKLEGDLLRVGLTPEETFVVLRKSPWNKFKGKRERQLWREIHKHQEASTNSNHDNHTKLNGVDFQKFMYEPLPVPKWAVEHIWSDEAHGILAGEAKTYKSLISLDLAVSVASGTKFLNHFSVPETGPVMVVQSENEPGLVQDRVTKIAYSRGLLDHVEFDRNAISMTRGKDLPIRFYNNEDINLAEVQDVKELSKEMKLYKPKLLILDPWYSLTVGIDESSQVAVAPVLTRLMELKRRHNCGILLVHHFRKPKRDTDGETDLERISGSSVFGRWFQSALVVKRTKERGEIQIVPYHREFPTQATIDVEFDMGGFGDKDYFVDVTVKQEELKTLSRHVRELVMENAGITIPELAEDLEVKKDRIRRIVERGPYRTRRESTGGRGAPAVKVWYKPRR